MTDVGTRIAEYRGNRLIGEWMSSIRNMSSLHCTCKMPKFRTSFSTPSIEGMLCEPLLRRQAALAWRCGRRASTHVIQRTRSNERERTQQHTVRTGVEFIKALSPSLSTSIKLGRAGDQCDDRGDRRFGIHQLSTYITFKLDLDMYSYIPDTHIPGIGHRQRLLPGLGRGPN